MSSRPRAERFDFGRLPDGRAVGAVRLSGGQNGGQTEAVVMAWGAGLQALRVPDRDGAMDDIALGHDTLAPYLSHPAYLGATVGRCANRIAGGRFTLDGQAVEVSRNEGDNSLHGGAEGFDKRLWTLVEAAADAVAARAVFELISPHGDQGFPGEVRLRVTYAVTADGKLLIDYEGRADRPTVLNPTNHALFNLSGAAALRSALDAELTLYADAFAPVDARLIPTGERRAVARTPFDFTQGRRLDARVRDPDEQLRLGRGYDHNFILRGGRTQEPRLAARLYDARSGRGMALLTTEPGLQLYTGNFLDGTLTGKQGRMYRQGDGVALEAQVFPDAVNRPDFPSPRLDPGQVYRQSTHHVFFTA